MLANQQRLTASTAALDEKRTAAGQLSRIDRNAVRAIGEEERRLKPAGSEAEPIPAGLAGQAEEALDAITKEESGVLDTSVVEQLRDVSVAARTIQRDQLPEDVVGAVVFLCTPAADFVTGQTMVIDGGQYFH